MQSFKSIGQFYYMSVMMYQECEEYERKITESGGIELFIGNFIIFI